MTHHQFLMRQLALAAIGWIDENEPNCGNREHVRTVAVKGVSAAVVEMATNALNDAWSAEDLYHLRRNAEKEAQQAVNWAEQTIERNMQSLLSERP